MGEIARPLCYIGHTDIVLARQERAMPIPQEDVLKRIARFNQLGGISDDLPDVSVDGYHRNNTW